MALKNAQHDMIMRNYEQKQLRTQNILTQRYNEIYEKIPKFKELEDSISMLGVKYARKLLDGNSHALAEFRVQLNTLCTEKSNLLIQNGYPKDYLEPVYECPLCKDTGYIGNEKCICFKQATLDLLYTQSNLKEILKKENFNTFSFDYYSDNFVDAKSGLSSLTAIKKAYQTCVDFVERFGEDFENLFLYGDTGVGKTFLSNCIAKELIDKSYSVIYFTAFELFNIFEKSKFGRDETAEVMNSHIFDCDLLIIDDLGTELSNSFTTSQLFLCLNERLLKKKSTIISTNLALETFSDYYSQRTFSRITSNYKLLKLIGDDIRLKKKLMNMEAN